MKKTRCTNVDETMIASYGDNDTNTLHKGGSGSASTLPYTSSSPTSSSRKVPRRQGRRVHEKGSGWITKSALTDRLEHIVLLELKEDGGREYRTMTLRELYNYVMKVLKYRPQQQQQQQQRRQANDLGHEPTSPNTLHNHHLIKGTTLKPRPPTPKSRESNNTTTTTTNAPTTTTNNNEQEVEPQTTPLVTYRERLGGYLHPRDMRRLVTPFSSSNEPELIVRRHVMLLNFDPLRAIVLRDRLLVLVPSGADSILDWLEKSVRGGIDELQNQVFGEGDGGEVVVGGGGISGVIVEEPSSALLENPVVTVKFADEMNKDGDSNLLDIDDYTTSICESDQFSSTTETEGQHQQTRTTEQPTMDDEWGDIEGMNWIKMTFELQCVDAVLSVVCKMLSTESTSLRQKVQAVMKQLRDDSITTSPGDHVQEQFRILKDELKEMEARVQGLVRAMNNILDEDEDMALMNLMRIVTHPERFIQPVSQEILNEESDEPELILEAYMQQALSEVNALELLRGNIMNTEELVSLKMDTIRNRLLYLNTMVSVFSLCISTASLIGSLFGMNLTNSLEDDENAFEQVVWGTMLGCLALLVLLIFYISKSGVMPTYMHRLVSADSD